MPLPCLGLHWGRLRLAPWPQGYCGTARLSRRFALALGTGLTDLGHHHLLKERV